MQEGKVIINKFLNGVNTDIAEDLLPNGFLSNGHNIKFTNDDNKQGIVQKQESYIKQLNGYNNDLTPLAAKSFNNVIYIVSWDSYTNKVEYGTYPSVTIPENPTLETVVGLAIQPKYAPLPNFLNEPLAVPIPRSTSDLLCTSGSPITTTVIVTTNTGEDWAVASQSAGIVSLSVLSGTTNSPLTITIPNSNSPTTTEYYVEVKAVSGTTNSRFILYQPACPNTRGSFSPNTITGAKTSVVHMTVNYIPGTTSTVRRARIFLNTGFDCATFSDIEFLETATITVTLADVYDQTGTYILKDMDNNATLDTLTVTTLIEPPTDVTITAIVDTITDTSGIGYGNVVGAGGGAIFEKGFEVVVDPLLFTDPSATKFIVSTTAALGNFSGAMTPLIQNTTYRYRAFARNGGGYTYSDPGVNFTTTALTIPSVFLTGTTPTSKTTSSAIIANSMIYGGVAIIDAHGLVFSVTSVNANPTVGGTGCSVSSPISFTPGSYSTTISGLSSNTNYSVKAYARTDAGSTYYYSPTIITFTTNAIGLATLAAVTFSDISSVGGIAYSNLTDLGGDVSGTLTTGFVWSANINPTTDNGLLVVDESAGLGAFASGITELTPGTTTYIRAYAINVAGTAYSTNATLTTLAAVPSIATNSASPVRTNSATLNGNVLANNGGAVISRGFQVATLPTDVSSAQLQPSGSGIGLYTLDISALSASATYYFRAYATNSAGTSYGSRLNFITESNTVTFGDITASKQSTYIYASCSYLKYPESLLVIEEGFSVNGIRYVATANPTWGNTFASLFGNFSAGTYQVFAYYKVGSAFTNSATSTYVTI